MDYIRPREKQLLACLPQIDGKDYKLTYEIEEEPPEPPAPPEYFYEPTIPAVETKAVPQEPKASPVLLGRKINEEPVPVGEVTTDMETVVIEGEVLKAEVRTLKSGRNLLLFDLTDYTDSISVKAFATTKQDPSAASGEGHVVTGKR